jgi:hypothetical protein
VVLLDRPYCKLGKEVRFTDKKNKGVGNAHNLRRVHARAYDFDAYFRVVLDDLLITGGLGRGEGFAFLEEAYLVL